MPGLELINTANRNNWLITRRWLWHLLFWGGYTLFRIYVYIITINRFPRIFLEFMLLSEVLFIVLTYYTLWLYKRLFKPGKYLLYFFIGGISWVLYLFGRTSFQFFYLKNAPGFSGNGFKEIILNSIAVVIVYFLFITACKYFKDGYITQQFETERKEQQLKAEINNLKSQIAPHFLFNTLNNLYGLSVSKSDKLPGLMLRLSDLLRHSLYETQKPLVPLTDELNVLKSYIELESVRLEDDLDLEFNNTISADSTLLIAPLLLIVFMENAFKHAKFVQGVPVTIYISTTLNEDWFELILKNNYNRDKKKSSNGIGIANVKRRLEVLYPNRHELIIDQDDIFFTVRLNLELTS
ncbi:MAG: hypothetical protein JWO32_2344 [Bacteroidetes bacterium]|nr:hypothetical protein [Bacteroidota bacterium]